MMNELQVFTHPEFGDMEIWIGPDSKPWFPATECAEVLGYSDPHKAISAHTLEAGWANRPVSHPSGTKQKKYINRPNLSRLIARSKLPEAAKFESWIFDDVLESVFDHGGYLTPQKIEEVLLSPDTIISLATQLKEERAARLELSAKVEADAPKVMFAEAVTAGDGSILVAELARYLSQNGVKIGEKRLFDRLRSDGYLCSQRGEKWNMPTQRAMDMGLFKLKKNVSMTEEGPKERKATTKVTGKGQVFFVRKYGITDISTKMPG